METKDYSALLKALSLLIPTLIIVFGLVLILRNNKSRSGEINFGNLSVKKSTAGIAFLFFGAICLIVAINKGVGMVHKESEESSEIFYDANGKMTSEKTTKKIVVDSTASVPQMDSLTN